MTDLIDSGVFIRHLTQDDPARWPLATQVLNNIARGARAGYTTTAAVAEVIYVLEGRSYRVARPDIRAGLLPLLSLSNLQVECPVAGLNQQAFYQEILDLYVSTGADFVDCYHALLARELAMGKVVTFDFNHFRLFTFIAHGCP